MTLNIPLLREAANFIDVVDEEIKGANDRKKDMFGAVRDQVAPEDFKAFREAIKLRRLRRADMDAAERHDERVWAILNALEGIEVPERRETPPRATAAPAIGNLDEEAPTRAPAHLHDAREAVPEHDPETGEITEPTEPSPEVVAAFAEAEEFPDIPPALDRRPKPMLEAAE